MPSFSIIHQAFIPFISLYTTSHHYSLSPAYMKPSSLSSPFIPFLSFTLSFHYSLVSTIHQVLTLLLNCTLFLHLSLFPPYTTTALLSFSTVPIVHQASTKLFLHNTPLSFATNFPPHSSFPPKTRSSSFLLRAVQIRCPFNNYTFPCLDQSVLESFVLSGHIVSLRIHLYHEHCQISLVGNRL